MKKIIKLTESELVNLIEDISEEVEMKEIENSFPFKAAKKLLTNKFEWAIDIKPKVNPFKYDSLMFLIVTIDTKKFEKSTPLTLKSYVNRWIGTDESYYGGLCVFLNEECGNPIIKNIENEMEDTLNIPIINQTVPLELKQPLKGRKFAISQYYLV